jgi:hypothetical protein
VLYNGEFVFQINTLKMPLINDKIDYKNEYLT